MNETKQLDPVILRTVYQELCASYHGIADLRAKLLGLLPLASGAVIWWASPTLEYPRNSAYMFAPLARAWPSSSRTRIAAPSPRVIPLLLASKGLQGVGSTTRSELKPPKVSSLMASLPPQIMTSAYPLLMRSAPYPMDVAEELQAVVIVTFGPQRQNRLDTASVE